MPNVLILADDTPQVRELSTGLARKGFTCTIVADDESATVQLASRATDLVLVAIGSSPALSSAQRLSQEVRQETGLPVVAMVSREELDRLDPRLGADDFVVEPWDATEVAMRARRALRHTGAMNGEEFIRCNDLVIDQGSCQVSLGGARVTLTFREYELLRFLAGNRGRVFSREALLNKVWGYDFYGGERTVDVHIRRIRSKIEDVEHTFIETVRNMGYRFSDSP